MTKLYKLYYYCIDTEKEVELICFETIDKNLIDYAIECFEKYGDMMDIRAVEVVSLGKNSTVVESYDGYLYYHEVF